MKWIGLTGCIGCGKSSVAKILKTDYGLPVVSADEVALSILKTDEELHDFIFKNMGILPFASKAMSLDFVNDEFKRYKEEIAAKVFENPLLLKKYEHYFHPKIKKKVQSIKKDLSEKCDLAFYDVPLLFEKNMENDFDGIVGVFSDQDVQMKRLKERENWSEEQIKNRIKHQVPNSLKIKKCDYIITNNLSFDDLKNQVRDLVAKLVKH